MEPTKPRIELEKLERRAEKHLQALVKYALAVNAGGIIATLTFAGTLPGRDKFTAWIAAPFAIFSFGLIFIGYSLLAQASRSGIEVMKADPTLAIPYERRLRWIGISVKEGEPRTGGHRIDSLYAALACFLLGVIGGLLIIVTR